MQLESNQVSLSIFRDTQGGGISYYFADSNGPIDSDGLSDEPVVPSYRESTPVSVWLEFAEPRIKLLKGLTWEAGDVTPIGYSRGAGDAPDGVQIVWTN